MLSVYVDVVIFVEHQHDAMFGVGIIVCFADVSNQLLAILLYHFCRMTVGCEEHLGVMMAENIVDIDADKDAYLLYFLQLLTQLEIAAGTKIANYGMEDVEVGHRGGDAVELVQQRRLYIVEEFSAHDVRKALGFLPFKSSAIKNRGLLSERRLWTAYIPKRESPRIAP